VPQYDKEIEFCGEASLYLGTDGQKNNTQLDMVRVTLHELHHGVGWITAYMDLEGGEDGEALRIVRDN